MDAVGVFLLYIVVVFVVPLGGVNNLGSDCLRKERVVLNGSERIEVELVNIDKVTVQCDKQRGLMVLHLHLKCSGEYFFILL